MKTFKATSSPAMIRKAGSWKFMIVGMQIMGAAVYHCHTAQGRCFKLLYWRGVWSINLIIRISSLRLRYLQRNLNTYPDPHAVDKPYRFGMMQIIAVNDGLLNFCSIKQRSTQHPRQQTAPFRWRKPFAMEMLDYIAAREFGNLI